MLKNAVILGKIYCYRGNTSAHGGLFKGGGLFHKITLGWGSFGEGLFQVGGLLKNLRLPKTKLILNFTLRSTCLYCKSKLVFQKKMKKEQN